MNKYERTAEAISRRPQAEQEKIRRAILSLREERFTSRQRALDVACDIVLAGDRTLRKRNSDDATDRRRRILIGARVPREFAERCREEAETRGLSLYAWVIWALDAGLKRPRWD